MKPRATIKFSLDMEPELRERLEAEAQRRSERAGLPVPSLGALVRSMLDEKLRESEQAA